MDAKGMCRYAPFPPHRKQSYYTPFLKFLQVFPRFFLKSLNFILRGRAFLQQRINFLPNCFRAGTDGGTVPYKNLRSPPPAPVFR